MNPEIVCFLTKLTDIYLPPPPTPSTLTVLAEHMEFKVILNNLLLW